MGWGLVWVSLHTTQGIGYCSQDMTQVTSLLKRAVRKGKDNDCLVAFKAIFCSAHRPTGQPSRIAYKDDFGLLIPSADMIHTNIIWCLVVAQKVCLPTLLL